MAVAPAAPEAGLSIGLILLAIACVFLLALNKAWGFTIGALLRSFASLVDGLPHVRVFGVSVPPWNALADALRSLDHTVLHAIGVGIQQTEKGLHALVGAMTWLLQETADQVAGLAQDTAQAFTHVRKVLIPSAVGVVVAPILRELAHLAARTRTIVEHPTTIVKATTRVIAPGLHALEGKVSALEARVAAIGAAAPAAIGTAVGGIAVPKPSAIPGDLTRGIDAIKRRLGALGRTLSPAGISGLVAGAVLSTLGLSWLKCRNVERAAKRACGMNPDILETLLAGTLAVFGTIGLVKFAEDVQDVTGDFAGEVAGFWRAGAPGPGGDRALGQAGHTQGQ